MEWEQLKARIDGSPELSGRRLAELTSRFVSVPSVNGEHPERDLARVIAEELEPYGYETHLVGGSDRPSLAATGEGTPRVVLNGHTDTVPVDDADQWAHHPYQGVIADGSVHGRGACDMKGGLAIQVAVAQWLATEGRSDGLVMHFAMGEERGEPGTESLLQAGFVAPTGIVLEPTDLKLGVAQRGLMTIRIVITGRAGHASRPDLTDNPIAHLPEVLGAVRHLDATPERRHGLLGGPVWTATAVHSGVIPSMVPGQCEVLVDRRMIPGETPDSVLATLARALSGMPVELSIAHGEGIYEPAEIPADCPTVARMARSLDEFGVGAEVFGTPYSSDVRHLINTAGIEAITFGPGRFSEMHARDEFIRVDDLVRAAHPVAAFCATT